LDLNLHRQFDRMMVALSMPDSESRRAHLQPLWDALNALATSAGPVETLRYRLVELETLLRIIRPDGNPARLVKTLRMTSNRTAEVLLQVHLILRSAWYPYEHTAANATISRYCCAMLPKSAQIGAVHGAASSTLNGYYQLYLRLLADLAQRAEEAEKEIGLLPMPEPNDKPEPA
jgi:hypothetical protein